MSLISIYTIYTGDQNLVGGVMVSLAQHLVSFPDCGMIRRSAGDGMLMEMICGRLNLFGRQLATSNALMG